MAGPLGRDNVVVFLCFLSLLFFCVVYQQRETMKILALFLSPSLFVSPTLQQFIVVVVVVCVRYDGVRVYSSHSTHNLIRDVSMFINKVNQQKSKKCHSIDYHPMYIARHQRPDVDITKLDGLIVVIIEILVVETIVDDSSSNVRRDWNLATSTSWCFREAKRVRL